MLGEAVTVVAPASEPLTIEDAKRFLRIDTDSLDQDVAMLIGAARGDIEDITGQRLVEQTVEIGADSFADLAHLTVGPVQNVVEIRYVDLAGGRHILPTASYDLVGAGLERGIVPAIGAALPPMRSGRGAIVARLLVGYGAQDPLPTKLRWALLAVVRGKFEEKPVDLGPMLVNARIYG